MSGNDDLALVEALAVPLGSGGDSLDCVLETVGRHLGLETGWIWLLDAETDRFYLAASLNLPPLLRRPVEMTAELCWCMDSFESGTLETKNVDIVACSRLRSAGDAPQLTGGLRFHASVALRSGERRLGIMNLTGPRWSPLAPKRLRLLETIGALLGVTLERDELAQAAAAARADERLRIARDLHDTLAQDLTAVGLQLERAERRLPTDPAATRRALAAALEITRDSLGRTRESIGALRGDPLGGKPLGAALASLAHAFTSQSGIRVTLAANARPLRSHTREVALYRIASEALTNVQRHAQAAHVRLELTSDERFVRLHVEDDGVGFDPSDEPSARYGLLGIRERAEDLDGTVTISRAAGGGTELDVALPLQASNSADATRGADDISPPPEIRGEG